jgi:hypothetical protein
MVDNILVGIFICMPLVFTIFVVLLNTQEELYKIYLKKAVGKTYKLWLIDRFPRSILWRPNDRIELKYIDITSILEAIHPHGAIVIFHGEKYFIPTKLIKRNTCQDYRDIELIIDNKLDEAKEYSRKIKTILKS